MSIMVINSNARSASYNVDDEIDAMELVNSLREDVHMHRRSCHNEGQSCNLNIFSSDYTTCCGSNNLHCDFGNRRRGANAAVGYESIVYSKNYAGHCRCKAGTYPKSDGTDCTACYTNGPGVPCQSACCTPRSDGRACCRSDSTPDGDGDTCCTDFTSTCSDTRCQSACCTPRSDGRVCCRGDGTPDGNGYACCTNFLLG